jgi:hypothetical protein
MDLKLNRRRKERLPSFDTIQIFKFFNVLKIESNKKIHTRWSFVYERDISMNW